jgi:hypothetical protein
MKKFLTYSKIALFAIALSTMWGCLGHTRIEKETYTITDKDSVHTYFAKNAPGNRDNGVIYPSSRTFASEKDLVQHDSIVEREYPDFIRMGVFESVGLMLSGSDYGYGTGLFGVYPDFDNLRSDYRGKSGTTFPGGIYRIGIGEWRLRWFRDDPNWTIGTSGLEVLMPDARGEKTLVSAMPIYIRKRFYLSEDIPYLAFTAAAGIGWYPSQYLNLSGSLDLGSIGGLNLRAYVGMAMGVNLSTSPMIRNSDVTDQTTSSIFPYAGLGVSVLDFVNIQEETEREWKDYEHSSWDIGLIQMGIVTSGADTSAFVTFDRGKPSGENSAAKGFIIKLANASVALPVLNNRFYAGTSLMNMIVLGRNEWGMGILPIRCGYWHTLVEDELTVEPFLEFNYYPSTMFHVGAKLNLKFSNVLNLNLIGGYVTGNSDNAFGDGLTENYGGAFSFSRAYFGISLGFMDQIFFPNQLRYNR